MWSGTHVALLSPLFYFPVGLCRLAFQWVLVIRADTDLFFSPLFSVSFSRVPPPVRNKPFAFFRIRVTSPVFPPPHVAAVPEFLHSPLVVGGYLYHRPPMREGTSGQNPSVSVTPLSFWFPVHNVNFVSWVSVFPGGRRALVRRFSIGEIRRFPPSKVRGNSFFTINIFSCPSLGARRALFPYDILSQFLRNLFPLPVCYDCCFFFPLHSPSPDFVDPSARAYSHLPPTYDGPFLSGLTRVQAMSLPWHFGADFCSSGAFVNGFPLYRFFSIDALHGSSPSLCFVPEESSPV